MHYMVDFYNKRPENSFVPIILLLFVFYNFQFNKLEKKNIYIDFFFKY